MSTPVSPKELKELETLQIAEEERNWDGRYKDLIETTIEEINRKLAVNARTKRDHMIEVVVPATIWRHINRVYVSAGYSVTALHAEGGTVYTGKMKIYWNG